MHIHHIGIWTRDLECQKEFYLKYFKATSNKKYVNEKKQFSSYFITFEGGGCIELMYGRDVSVVDNSQRIGIAHVAIDLGSRLAVDELTKQLAHDGYTVVSSPRVTGDGYYESVIFDPEMNRIELVAELN